MTIVDGFLFENEEEAKQAQKEEEGIRFIKERTALNNPEVVFKLYKKLLEQELFVTPVGQRFMVELQNILYASNYIPKDEIPPIKAKTSNLQAEPTREADTKKTAEKPVQKQKEKNIDYKKSFQTARLFAIIFGVSVIGMFAITKISGNSVTILNYRNEIINEYSAWQAELTEKEEKLREKEKELTDREEAVSEREAALEEESSEVQE